MISTVKIQLDGIKEQVAHAFIDRNNEINHMILDTIESTITQAWVQEEINNAVRACIHDAISGLVNDGNLVRAIRDVMSEKLVTAIKDNE